jgi:hypothetical protein
MEVVPNFGRFKVKNWDRAPPIVGSNQLGGVGERATGLL